VVEAVVEQRIPQQHRPLQAVVVAVPELALSALTWHRTLAERAHTCHLTLVTVALAA
jgi:hypothetical protein